MKIYKNKITFNCANYHPTTITRPPHCYNCMMRQGYPLNLGGDKYCENFKQISEELRGGEMKRPVICLFCKRQMYYRGETKFEPEFSIILQDPEEKPSPKIHYVHRKCWKRVKEIKLK